MPTIPLGRLTRKQIVDLATRKAGNTQLGANTATSGGDAQTWLNQLLYDLYSQYNWPFLNTSTMLQLNGPQFALPDDFLKAVDDYSLEVFTIDGQQTKFFILEADRAQFEVSQVNNTNATGDPQIYTVDRNLNVAYLFPGAQGHTYGAVLRYQKLPPDIDVTTAGDAVVPVFPWSYMVVQALYVNILEFEFDGRADSERAKLERMLEGVREAAQPLRSMEASIPLDPSIFHSPFRGD